MCHWCSYHILTSPVIYFWTDASQHGVYLFYIITKSFFFISKYFNITWKPAFAPPLPTLPNMKKAIWHNLWSIQNEVISLATIHSKELWLAQENHPTVKPGLGSSSVSLCGMKTYSESRIELRNLQILKKMLEKSSQFLSPEQPCELKSLDVALNIAGVEKISSENLWLRST